jgi:branched-chain amino acid transport system substrate-binding protein
MGWDVPFIGHPTMGAGEVGRLIAKPENWQKTYILGFKNCSYGPGRQASGARAGVRGPHPRQDRTDDTILWWVLCGVDAIDLIARAVQEAGSTDAAAIIRTGTR